MAIDSLDAGAAPAARTAGATVAARLGRLGRAVGQRLSSSLTRRFIVLNLAGLVRCSSPSSTSTSSGRG
jgi:hypothetical protein